MTEPAKPAANCALSISSTEAEEKREAGDLGHSFPAATGPARAATAGSFAAAPTPSAAAAAGKEGALQFFKLDGDSGPPTPVLEPAAAPEDAQQQPEAQQGAAAAAAAAAASAVKGGLPDLL